MKQRNPIAVWLGLPLITLGIYYYVWLYKIHSELGMFDRRRIVGATGPMLAWLCGIVTPVHLATRLHLQHRQTIAAAQRSAGLVATCSGGIGVLLVFVFGMQSLYFQAQLNKVVAANPAAPEGTQFRCTSDRNPGKGTGLVEVLAAYSHTTSR